MLVSLQYNRGKGLGPNGCRLVQVQYQKPTDKREERRRREGSSVHRSQGKKHWDKSDYKVIQPEDREIQEEFRLIGNLIDW